jgi:hypothetical protein
VIINIQIYINNFNTGFKKESILIMNTQDAITAFAQGDKIKSGIIWAVEIINSFSGLGPREKAGAEKTGVMLIQMIGFEAVLVRRATGNDAWINVEKDLDMALVMIHSGVSGEAVFHLSKALAKTTTLSQKGVSYLIANGLL